MTTLDGVALLEARVRHRGAAAADGPRVDPHDAALLRPRHRRRPRGEDRRGVTSVAMDGNDLPTPPHGFKPSAPPSCTKGVNSPSGMFGRDLPVTRAHGSGLELALALAGCMCVAAVFAGYPLALAGLTALPLLANARTRPVRVSSPAIAVGETHDRRDRSDA